MQRIGREDFVSALQGLFPPDCPQELIEATADRSKTPMVHVRDGVVGGMKHVYVIPDSALQLLVVSAALAATGIFAGSPPAFFTWFVKMIFDAVNIYLKTADLSKQEQQLLICLTLGPATPEQLQRRLESAQVAISMALVRSTLERFRDLDMVKRVADGYWEVSTTIHNLSG